MQLIVIINAAVAHAEILCGSVGWGECVCGAEGGPALQDFSGEDVSENFPKSRRSFFEKEFGVRRKSAPRARGCVCKIWKRPVPSRSEQSWNISAHVNVELV